MSDLYFEYPKVASFIVIYIACEAYCRLRLKSLYFPQIKIFSKETHRDFRALNSLRYMAIVMMVLAMMSPVKDEKIILNIEPTVAIGVVLEQSENVEHFQYLKGTLVQLINDSNSDTLALYLYDENVYHLSPFTQDDDHLNRLLEYTQSSTKAATAFESALQILHEEVQALDLSSKWIIVLKKGLHRSVHELSGVQYLYVDTQQSEAEITDAFQKFIKNANLQHAINSYTLKTYLYFYPLFIAFLLLLLYVYLLNKRGVK